MHGDKRMKPSDYELVRKIKEQVQNLPDLSIPPEAAHIVIETDGCMEGWGGVIKWKHKKDDPRSSEQVCAYASGKFQNVQSTIDAEINACINTLEKLKIYYLDKDEVTLRTDCQAIISFYNKTNSNKASRVRWMRFADAVTGTGVKITIEHIDGKHNLLADSLSRLVNLCFAECTEPMKTVLMAAVAAIQEVRQEEEQMRTQKQDYHGISPKRVPNVSGQLIQISDHCVQSIHKLYKSKENTMESTRESKGRSTHVQAHLVNPIPHYEESRPKWKVQYQEGPCQPLQNWKTSLNSEPNSVTDNAQATTIGMMYGPSSRPNIPKPDGYCKKPKSYEMTSNDTPCNVSSDEDNDDDIIVDPGWEDSGIHLAKNKNRAELKQYFPKIRWTRM